jgi:hypothetical protein
LNKEDLSQLKERTPFHSFSDSVVQTFSAFSAQLQAYGSGCVPVRGATVKAVST